ncbi:hypothetical protein M9Y10_039437 [Tritrichomonas musculus]|uniref:Uncharacterized protein n=1 Tax=Tritrichomonas musculus TaxID=1915356 RepID=A0ABR2KB74_9EUKA
MFGNYIEKFLEEYKNIHANFLDFICCGENIEESFSNLKQKIEDTKIRACPHKLRLFIHMILEINNNHHRGPNFFSKIDRILQIIKDDIKKHFTNSKILDIFKTSKQILLFLIE